MINLYVQPAYKGSNEKLLIQKYDFDIYDWDKMGILNVNKLS